MKAINKNKYCQPEIEINPIAAMAVLCSSNPDNAGLNVNTEGGSQGSGRTPRRTKVF